MARPERGRPSLPMVSNSLRTRTSICVFLACGVACAAALPGSQIIRRSIAANERSWRAAPGWSFKERDVTKEGGNSKTYRVLMIDGSQYNLLLAINDHPLSPEEKAAEEEKLQEEIRKRKNETPGERSKRIGRYRQERNQDNAMMLEMADAFNFRPAGEESIGGRPAYVFDASPKPGYVPKNRDAKVLTGMKGRLWVDKRTFQWAKVQAEVITPVSFYGFLAKVEPGTSFLLEQAPVAAGLWFPIRFREQVNAKALGVIDENSLDEETYSDYQPLSQALLANSPRHRPGAW
jgi:hypothetical protein